MSENKREPFVKKLSAEVRVLYGYADAHVRVEVLAPGGITVPKQLKNDQVVMLYAAFRKAHTIATMSEEERKKAARFEEVLDPQAKYQIGFPDGHMTLFLRAIPKLPPWIPVEITRQEILEGAPALKEIVAWGELPEDVRKLQGIS